MIDLAEYRKSIQDMKGPELFEEKERLKSIYRSQANNPEKWAEGQEVAKVYIDVQHKKALKFSRSARPQPLVGFYR